MRDLRRCAAERKIGNEHAAVGIEIQLITAFGKRIALQITAVEGKVDNAGGHGHVLADGMDGIVLRVVYLQRDGGIVCHGETDTLRLAGMQNGGDKGEAGFFRKGGGGKKNKG